MVSEQVTWLDRTWRPSWSCHASRWRVTSLWWCRLDVQFSILHSNIEQSMNITIIITVLCKPQYDASYYKPTCKPFRCHW